MQKRHHHQHAHSPTGLQLQMACSGLQMKRKLKRTDSSLQGVFVATRKEVAFVEDAYDYESKGLQHCKHNR